MFTKASQPQAYALFSDKAIITKYDGKPVFMFRVGNARGNEIIDASITVSLLKEEITTEGHHLRRLHDLKLVRDSNPLFSMTWTVMHEIDESSPLYGIDWAQPNPEIMGWTIMLIGHDGIYSQTVYARHQYSLDQVRSNEKFVDVLSELPDGRMVIDYSKFHDTVAE